MLMNKNLLLLTLALSVSASLSAKEVFNWKDNRGVNTYSDVPRNLQPAQSNLMNVNTQTVTQAAPPAAAPGAQAASGSIAEQQLQLSQQIAAQNKATEEQNKKIEAANRQQQEDNCKAARLNRTIAEGARTDNRAALLARYDADIQKFCQ